MSVSIKFEPRDMWIGIYWDRQEVYLIESMSVRIEWAFYVCVIPCFPIIFTRTYTERYKMRA